MPISRSRLCVIFAFSFFAVALILEPSMVTHLFALPPDPKYQTTACEDPVIKKDGVYKTCCWREKVSGKLLGEVYCQTCKADSNGQYTKCEQKELQFRSGTFGTLNQSSPAIPPGGGGVLQTESAPSTPPLKGGGVLNAPPTDQGLQSSPTLSNEAPPAPPPQSCPEGQELDQQTGLCVPSESSANDAGQSEESTQAPNQSTEESGDSGDSSNDNNDDDNNDDN